MRRDYSTEQFASFVQEVKESFWGDLQGRVQQTVKAMLEVDSEQRMEEYRGRCWYGRPEGEAEPVDSRNGHYEHGDTTPWGIIRFRVRRTRFRSFLPRILKAFERRAPGVAGLIGQAILRGIATRAVGRVVALVTGEAISAQTISRLTRVLDAQVCAFHEAQLADDWAYLLRDGVWMKVRRSLGPRRVLLLVAYGIRPDGERRLLAIERCFVEVRRGTRPMVVFTNVQSVDRIIYAIFNRFNEDWQTHTLELFTQNA